jgi:hypothetical protein
MSLSSAEATAQRNGVGGSVLSVEHHLLGEGTLYVSTQIDHAAGLSPIGQDRTWRFHMTADGTKHLMYCDGGQCAFAKAMDHERASDVTGTFPILVDDGSGGAGQQIRDAAGDTPFDPGLGVRGKVRLVDSERPTPTFGVWARSEDVGVEASTTGDVFGTAGTLYYCHVEEGGQPRCFRAADDLGMSRVLSVHTVRRGSGFAHVIWATATRATAPNNFFLAWMKTWKTKLVRCVATDAAPTPECKEISL